jgi:hypothetical protein
MEVRMRRDVLGSSQAESSLIIAVIAILLTRGYLALTGYSQVGGGSLHIAHAVWGGALMMSALVAGRLFRHTARAPCRCAWVAWVSGYSRTRSGNS